MPTRTWRGTTSGNYNVNGNWLEGTFPTSADDVVFDGTFTNNLVVNVASACKTINFANYTGTVTMTNNLSVSGSITLSAGMGTISGAGALIGLTTATHTSNGKTWGSGFSLQGNGVTHTLADAWVVTGNMTLGTSNTTTTINGNSITFGGGLSMNGNAVINGTTTLTANGTGTFTGGVGAGHDLRLALTINTSGTITYATTTFFRHGGDFTHIAGTVITTSSTVAFNSVNINSNTVDWNHVTLQGASTTTLGSNMTVNGTLTFGSSNNTQTINGFTIYAKGNVALGTGNSIVIGTTVLELATTTSQTVTMGTGTGNSHFRNNITFNASGTVNLSGNINFNTGTITYTAGSVNAGSSTLVIAIGSTTTFNTNGMTWNNIAFTNVNNGQNFTATLNSTLSVSGTLSLSGSYGHNLTFNGTGGFTVGTFSSTMYDYTMTFKAGTIYRVQSTLTQAGGISSAPILFKSDTPGSYAYFYLNNGASQSMTYVNGTDINSALGQTIWSFGATLSNTVNWNPLTVPPTVAHAYVV